MWLMRAVQLTGAFGIEELKIQEAAEKPLGPGEARLRVHAVSVNYRDILVAKGLYTKKLPFPLTICSDAAGEVIETGPGVSRVKTGDRVCPAFMPAWTGGEVTDQAARSALGAFADGVLAETIVMPETALVPIPAHLSYEEASTLPCAGVTAWNALVERGRLRAGETVLTLGTGGVSVFALQFAKLAGARVIITSSSDEKLERAKALGADAVVNYKTNPEWDEAMKKLGPVDHIVEVGGTGTLNKSIKVVRMGGHIALIGQVSGGAEANLLPAFMKSLRLNGVFVGSRETFAAMNRAVGLHGMKPVVDRVFGFEEAGEALRYMESGAHFGKVVIKVN